MAELTPKPHRPIPNSADIRLPDWCDRRALEAWVRRETELGFDLRHMEVGGKSARSLVKGLQRAILLQQRLIQHEGWPTAG